MAYVASRRLVLSFFYALSLLTFVTVNTHLAQAEAEYRVALLPLETSGGLPLRVAPSGAVLGKTPGATTAADRYWIWNNDTLSFLDEGSRGSVINSSGAD